ncbi:glycosyltransferase family 2 protein, partial [Methylophilaceae bacterium]|nr:glycosyltransferase family 2 protein [Methylophilaceae bacterium]
EVSTIMNSMPYSYEYIFIDNCSTDDTVSIIKKLAKKDKNIKLIVNARNFGHIRSPQHAIYQTTGDACILMHADLQDPPTLIKDFISKWESGYKIVLGQKVNSQENKFMFYLRKKYYDFMNKISESQILSNCTGFGLMDQEVVKIMRKIDDPYPYLRGLLVDIGFPIALIPYTQRQRHGGNSNSSFYTLYDYFMLGITQHSKVPLRIITIFGFIVSFLSLIIALIFLILKILFWDSFIAGGAPMLIGIFFFGSLQAFFIGVLGEYIGSINTRVKRLPLVVESERVNFK